MCVLLLINFIPVTLSRCDDGLAACPLVCSEAGRDAGREVGISSGDRLWLIVFAKAVVFCAFRCVQGRLSDREVLIVMFAKEMIVCSSDVFRKC